MSDAKPFSKILLRSRVRVERVLERGESQGPYVAPEPGVVYWVAKYDDSLYYRQTSLGRLNEYSRVEFEADGLTYDLAMEALGEIATGQGWTFE